MANLGQVFQANQYEPIGEMGALPPDWYQVMITESELKGTKGKDGQYLAVTYTVVNNPKFKNRKVFENLNINNKNPATVEIAMRTLAAICQATGKAQIQDSAEVHNIPFEIKLGIERGGSDDKGNIYADRNSVIGYRAIEGALAVNNPMNPMVSGAPGNFAPTQPAFQPPVQPAFQPPTQVTQAPVIVMTEKAGEATFEQFIAAGWTKELMISEGFAIEQYPQQPAQFQPPAPQAPQAPQAPVGGPPWAGTQAQAPMQQQAAIQQPSPQNANAAPPWAR